MLLGPSKANYNIFLCDPDKPDVNPFILPQS